MTARNRSIFGIQLLLRPYYLFNGVRLVLLSSLLWIVLDDLSPLTCQVQSMYALLLFMFLLSWCRDDRIGNALYGDESSISFLLILFFFLVGCNKISIASHYPVPNSLLQSSCGFDIILFIVRCITCLLLLVFRFVLLKFSSLLYP